MPDPSTQDDPRRQPWRDWIAGQSWSATADEPTRERALQAAIAALDRGMSSTAAAVAAQLAVGPLDPGLRRQLAAERQRVQAARAELAGIPAWGDFTEAARAGLSDLLKSRAEFLDSLERQGEAPAALPPFLSRAPESAPAAAPPRPAPSFQEFVSENGILVLSYIGAFLLIVATVIFEVYGTSGTDGALRLDAVLALNLVFAAAGAYFLRRPALRFVGTAYVALAALMAPLSIVAAYVFVLRDFGVTPEEAVLAASLACTILYGALAMALGSRGYAWLSVGAVAIAGVALTQVDDAGTWSGFQLTLVPLVYAVAASYRGDRRFRDLFGQAIAVRMHVSAAVAAMVAMAEASTLATTREAALMLTATVALLTVTYTVHARDRRQPPASTLALLGAGLAWVGVLNILELGAWQGPLVAAAAVAYGWLGSRPDLFERAGLPVAWTGLLVHAATAGGVVAAVAFTDDPSAVGWPVVAALAAGTAAYALVGTLRRSWREAWLVALGVTASAVTAARVLAFDSGGFATVLTAVAAGYVLAAGLRQLPGPERQFLRVGAAVQLAVMAALPVASDPLHALLLFGGAAIMAGAAFDAREPPWLYGAAALAAWAWYWLVAAVAPPPPNPGPDTVVLVYSPLPILLGLVGAALWWRLGRGWGEPFLVAAAVVATGVVAGGIAQADYALLAADLGLYATAAYCASCVRDDLAWVAPLALLAGAGAAAAALRLAEAPAWAYPLVLDAGAALALLAGMSWGHAGRRQLGDLHAYTALAGAAAVALGCLAAPGMAVAGDPFALAGALSVVSLSGMLYIRARDRGEPALEYAALLVVTFVAYWSGHYLGLTSPEVTVAACALGAVAAGVLVPHDPRVADLAQFGLPLASVALAVVLGTTFALTIDADEVASGYVALLAVESVAAVVAGVGMRSRALVLGGSVGVLAAALRGVVILSDQYPLWVVFGGVAMLLLAVSAALALLRERLGDFRATLAVSWSSWS